MCLAVDVAPDTVVVAAAAAAMEEEADVADSPTVAVDADGTNGAVATETAPAADEAAFCTAVAAMAAVGAEAAASLILRSK